MNVVNFLRKFKIGSLGTALQIAAACFALSLCSPAYSQTLGRISGQVTDTSGGAVSGATVTVTDVTRGIPRTLTTDAAGTYSAPNLTAGAYSVHAVFAGFKAFDRQDIQVGVGADVHVDVTLEPGEQTQTITVTGEAPAIITTNAQLSATITGDALSDLPIAGHNYVQLLALLPSFQLRQGSATGPSQYSNGLRAEYNMYVLDGVVDSETYFTGLAINTGYSAGGPEQAVLLPTDAIEEFNVVENSKAEFGWRPGAQVNVAIKSGTNSIHGTAFASGRGTGLTDRNAFATFTPPVSFEDFDATIGGPIKKDKLFYLIGYEGQRYSVGNPKNLTVATLVPGTKFSPSTSIPDAIKDLQAHPAGAQPNPVMVAMAGCVLGPPITCTPGAGLFSNNTQSTTFPVDFNAFGKTDNGVGKLDYHLNDHNNLATEFFDGDGFAVAPLNATQPYWSTPFEVHTRVARAWWTWVPNSTWVNDARFGWDNILISNTGSYDCPANPATTGGVVDNQWVPGAGAQDYAKAFGFVSGGLPQCGSANNSAFPTVTIAGLSGANANALGGATGTFDTSGIERWLDSVSWTHGNHITKFGGEFMLAHGTPVLNVGNNKGTLAFNTNAPTRCAFSGGAGTATGCGSLGATALDNFMAGIVTSASLQIGTVPRQFSYKGFAGFVQDDWRILPRVTVNLGLRYEYTTTIKEANNLLGTVDLTTVSGVRQQGQGAPLYKLDPWGFGPRFGLAWDVTGKATTVLRTGFNIAYQSPTIQAFITPGMNTVPTAATLKNAAGATIVAAGTAGTINTANITNIAPANLAAATIVPGQSFFSQLGALSLTCSAAAPCQIGGAASRIQMPEVLNWSFGVQHAITNNLTIDANYVGTHGQHLFDSIDINQPAPGVTNTPTAENARRPFAGQFPWFSQMRVLAAATNVSNYNAMQIIVRERASHGLTMIATYTYGHALDTQSSDLGPALPQDSTNLAAEYGNSSFDTRHRFTVGPSYNIPGRPGYWQMLQGWQVTSTAKVWGGAPINPTDPVAGGNDISGNGEGTNRWTLAGDPHDFTGFGDASTIPCFYNPVTAKAAWVSACTAGLPTACVNAANAEQQGPGGSGAGITQLNTLGCYMKGSAVMVPPAPGTYGTMSRYAIYSLGTWEVDASVIKTWKIKEKLTTQFRAEIYNLTNSTYFSGASSNLNSPSTFGASSSTPDTNSPFVGTGGPRKIQLGLKFLF